MRAYVLFFFEPALTGGAGAQGSSSPTWMRCQTTNKKTAMALTTRPGCPVPCCRRCYEGAQIPWSAATFRGCYWLGCCQRRLRLCGHRRRRSYHRCHHLSLRPPLGPGHRTRRWTLNSDHLLFFFFFLVMSVPPTTSSFQSLTFFFLY